MAEMITTEQALELINNSVLPLKTEKAVFLYSLKRVLAEPVYSDVDFPPFNRSAMDGYACRKSDLHLPLIVIEEIPAGTSPTKIIGEGQCAKIMTGVEVPEGADTVIIKEEVTILDNQTIIFNGEKSHSNISLIGEDVRTGDKLLDAGQIIKPQHLALFAGVGKAVVEVFKKPSVAIVTTGSEIVPPDIFPSKGKIRNSNGPQLLGQLKEVGLEADDLGIFSDVEADIREIILSALNGHDLIIVSGGVSVGDYDFMPKILKDLGFSFLFDEISSKPGKHTILGQKGNKYVLGLPGNPVSAFVQFEILGKALIYKLMGLEFKQVRISATLSDGFERKKSDRSEIIPVKINPKGEIEKLSYHGSAHIQALAYADALMEIPLGIKRINKGESVYVRPL